jgi:hypothetical protein
MPLGITDVQNQLTADQAAPMDVEMELQQYQALEQQQSDPFFSG